MTTTIINYEVIYDECGSTAYKLLSDKYGDLNAVLKRLRNKDNVVISRLIRFQSVDDARLCFNNYSDRFSVTLAEYANMHPREFWGNVHLNQATKIEAERQSRMDCGIGKIASKTKLESVVTI